MALDDVWETFYLAVRGVARSPDPLQQRLAHAYLDHLRQLRRDELPASIRDDFRRLEQALTRVRAKGGAGDVVASAAVLSDLEARDLIELVVSMYNAVAECRVTAEEERRG